jgi:hypothetical protein
MFGFLCGPLTQFPLHFATIHRYILLFFSYLCAGSLRKLRAFAVGVFFDSSYPSCAWLSHALTTMPFPTPYEASEFRWGFPYLLSTLLSILHRGSRVRRVGLNRNVVGGAFLTAPSTLCGFLTVIQGTSGLPASQGRHHMAMSPVVPISPVSWVSGLVRQHIKQGMLWCSFPVGLCALQVIHHDIPQPSTASWILAFSSQCLSGPCCSPSEVVRRA